MNDVRQITALLQKKSGFYPVGVVPVSGGFNCDVYKGTDKKGSEYFIKKYKVTREKPDVRLATEFSALKFLWKNNVHTIPKPLQSFPDELLGVYEFIHGKSIPAGLYSHSDVETALHFWESIDRMKHDPGAIKLPNAKEACFTISDYIKNLENRIKQLEIIPDTISTNDMKIFLSEKLKPLFVRIKEFIFKKMTLAEQKKVLDKKFRTLSSSDFGFHNAIRKDDGTIIFHDFEYFGWDDPAKFISDFFLHPRMALPATYREEIYTKVYTVIGDPQLPRRLPFVYLLLAVKWCLIMLNVFKEPQIIAGKNKNMSHQQLAKTKKLLSKIELEMNQKTFPVSLIHP